MNSIGETLRRERLRQNLDLQKVATETKISVKLLEAIESDDFSKLPGGVFAKSFVRQYARMLGLDEEELAVEVQRVVQPPVDESKPPGAPSEPEIVVPRVAGWDIGRRRTSSSLPALAMVVVVMLVCSGIYAWWQRSKQTPQPPPPPAVTAAVPAPAKPAPAAETPVPTPEVQSTEAPATPPSAATEPTAERSAAPGAVQVLLTAAEETWISARSDGKYVYSGTLKPNEKKELSGDGEVRLVIGNAGGIAITLNGQPLAPVGPKGQVRVIQLSPGGVQIVPPKPPSAPPDTF